MEEITPASTQIFIEQRSMETLGKATMTISKSMTMTSTWGEGPGERNLGERGEGPGGEGPGGNPPGGVKFRKSEAANSL